MTHCSLSALHLDLLLSLTPALRHLKLASQRKMLDSVFDSTYWENLISIKLPKLDKFEFIFFYTDNKNDDSINPEALIAPFRSSFWLHDKRWFVASAYVLRENEIWLHTTPINCTGIKDLVRVETSWMDNGYRLTGRPLNKILDTSADKTLTKLDLHSNRISGQKIQYLINALYNNTALVELNLGNSQTGDREAQDLAHALQNNSTLPILGLWQNQIGHQGAQYFADVLRNNTALKELYLQNNSIRDLGAQYLAHALQNNTILTTLNLDANGIGRDGIQNPANTLENNKTVITLGLGYNQIGDQEARYLVNALAKSLFGCFSDIKTCCCGFCCLPCTFGDNVEKTDGTSCIGCCLAYWVSSACYLCWVPHMMKRKVLRQKYLLKPEPCHDCLVTACCGPCAVCQEARELKSRGGAQGRPNVLPVRVQPVAYRK
ncbi:unnamed protein product [Adineta steineri]|uniref:Uncharacterized protein n=2 Tax=Adineta steineri TaxID=433720 RepID=A0A813MUX6_9BILA|nr:unnamed protein product [Adineta steineri]